jgi:hypothetical protein
MMNCAPAASGRLGLQQCVSLGRVRAWCVCRDGWIEGGGINVLRWHTGGVFFFPPCDIIVTVSVGCGIVSRRRRAGDREGVLASPTRELAMVSASMVEAEAAAVVEAAGRVCVLCVGSARCAVCTRARDRALRQLGVENGQQNVTLTMVDRGWRAGNQEGGMNSIT